MSSPRTGCWVPLKHFHAKVMDFMSVTSPIIFIIERLLTIGTASWPQGQTTASGSRRSTQWRNIPSQWRCRGFASGRSAFFLRKLDLLPLHMTWRHLEFTWSLRTSLLFRRRQQLSIVTTGDPGWRALLLLGIELRSPPGISPKRRGACSLLGLGFHCLAPGVQGEGELGPNGEGKVEDLALAGQCLAKSHTLGGQGGWVFSTHFLSLLLNYENRLELCWHVASSLIFLEDEKGVPQMYLLLSLSLSLSLYLSLSLSLSFCLSGHVSSSLW